MWDYDHETIPETLKTWFNKPHHSYPTRFAMLGKLTPPVSNSTKFGIYSFRNEGTKLLNELKDTELYLKSRSRKYFITKFKNEIINNYLNEV